MRRGSGAVNGVTGIPAGMPDNPAEKVLQIGRQNRRAAAVPETLTQRS